MNYLIESSICLVLFYGLYHFLFKDTTAHFANRIYLLTSLLVAALIPTLSLPIFKNQVTYSPSANISIGHVQFIPDEAVLFNWSLLWFYIYLAGVIVSFLVFFTGLYKIVRIILQGERTVNHDHSIIYTSADLPLCSFGKFIIAPLYRKGNLTEYELTHEINHLKSLHTLDVLFIKLFRCLFWFNPIVLLYERRLIEVHEYQADSATLNHLGRESYLSFIIDQVSIKSKYSIVHNFNSLIKKRLIMMSSESRSGYIHYLAVIPVLLVVLSLFSFDTYDEYVDKDGNMFEVLNDTIPDGAVLDTFITQASINGRDIKWVVIKEDGKDAYIIPSDDPMTKLMMDRIDTISTIDYDTYKETMVTFNYKTGVIDTLIYEK